MQAERECVFLSYSRKDADAADLIELTLEDSNVDCWRDTGEIPAGSLFRERIPRAIRDARFLILLVSRHSIVSPEVQSEAAFAQEERTDIIPVYLEPLDEALPDRLRYLLAGRDRIELYRDTDRGLSRLVSAVTGAVEASHQLLDTSFAALSAEGESGAQRHAQALEEDLAFGRRDAHRYVALANCYLYLTQFREARANAKRALELDPSMGPAYWAAALAVIGGRRPRALTKREAERAVELLSRGAQLEPAAAHFDVLAALIKLDFYEGNGLRAPAPDPDELMTRTAGKALDRSEIARMQRAVAVDEAVWAWVTGNQHAMGGGV